MPAVEVASHTKLSARTPAAKRKTVKKRRKPKLFISYRHKTSSDVSGRLRDRLIEEFGPRRVIKDTDSFPAGYDFSETIRETMRTCTHVLALIGRDWLKNRKQKPGKIDWVLYELKCAIEFGIPIIPILLNGVRMPSESKLPRDLRALAKYQAVALRPDPDFHIDANRLITQLRKG